MEVVGWYDKCFFWYSNRSMGSIDHPFGLYAWNTQNILDSSNAQRNQTIADLLSAFLPEVVSGEQLRKYVSHNTAPESRTLYGMMKCTLELLAMDCSFCLKEE
ncbi:putative Gnk2-like domain-containing protein [Helianthus anomalus]